MRQYGRPTRMRRHQNTISNTPMGDGPAIHDNVMQAVVQTLSHIVGDRKRSRPNLLRANEHQPSMTEAPSRKSAPEPEPLQVALDQWLRLARGLDAREATREPVELDARLRPGTGGSAPPDLEERGQQAESDIRPKPPTAHRSRGAGTVASDDVRGDGRHHQRRPRTRSLRPRHAP